MHVKFIHATLYDKFYVNSTTTYESLQQHITLSMDIHYQNNSKLVILLRKRKKFELD